MTRLPAGIVAALVLSLTLVGGATAARPAGFGPALERATEDRPDITRKAQVHVMYVLPSDGLDRQLDTDGTLTNTVSAFQSWLAKQTTNGKALRFDTFDGSLDVTFVRLGRTDAEMAAFGPFVRDEIEAELEQDGLLEDGKLYAVYYDGTSTFSCGGGAWPPLLPGSVAAVYLNGLPDASVPCASQPFAAAGGMPTYLEFAMLHEILHTAGFVPACAPHHFRAGHVFDDANDLMWGGDGPWAPAGWDHIRLDSGRDDYYKAAVPGCLDFHHSRLLTKWSAR